MKKFFKSIVILVLCIFAINSNAQDLITKKDGTDISAKVLEISSSEIKYKKFENLSGPIYTILKSDALMIRYENGTKDLFNESVSVDYVSSTKKVKYENKINPENVGKGEMIIGEEIRFEKGFWKHKIFQNDRKLNFHRAYSTLQDIDVCKTNMIESVKYSKRNKIYTLIAVVTMPSGVVILLAPMIISGNKSIKYLKSAIDDYNNSLK